MNQSSQDGSGPQRENNQQRLRDAYWPEITDPASARRAAFYGVWAAAATIVMMLVRLALDGFALPAEFGIEGLLIELLAFAACGGAIWLTGSRLAACGGLLLFMTQKYLQFDAGIMLNFGTVLIWLGIAVLWLTAIRGTFRLHGMTAGNRDD